MVALMLGSFMVEYRMAGYFRNRKFCTRNEFQRVLISKSTYFEDRMDFK